MLCLLLLFAVHSWHEYPAEYLFLCRLRTTSHRTHTACDALTIVRGMGAINHPFGLNESLEDYFVRR